jgi:hypothetical protein
MKVWALVNVPLRKVVEVYGTEAAAQLARDRVLADEPGWAPDLDVQAIEVEIQQDEIRLRSVDSALIDVTLGVVPKQVGSSGPPWRLRAAKQLSPKEDPDYASR